MRSYLYKIFKRMALFILLILCYIAILMIGHLIPKEWVMQNVVQSYEQIKQIGIYYDVVEGAQWDNWTDTYFLNSSVTEFDGNLLQKAVANAYTVSKNENTNVLDHLYSAVNEDKNTEVSLYSRYWAGNLTLYKILLMFMPISGIRNVLVMVTIALFAFAIINIYNILGYKGVIPFVITILMCKYIPLSMCLTFSSDIILMLFAINFCAIKQKKTYYLLFSIIGSLGAFLGYWAFPLITIGIPLVFVAAVRTKNGDEPKSIIVDTILMSVSWLAGLAATVASKQVLCYIVLGTQTGTDALSYRMGTGHSIGQRVISVKEVVFRVLSDNAILFMIASVILLSVFFVKRQKNGKKYEYFPFLLLAIYPLVWCFLLAQHNVHGFVVYMYGVAFYSVFSIVFAKNEFKINIFEGKEKKIIILAIWIIASFVICKTDIYYSNKIQEPWSMEETDYITISENTTLKQQIDFDESETIHLKYIKAIFTGAANTVRDGVINVLITEDDDVVSKKSLAVRDIIKNDSIWTKFQGDGIIGRISRKLADNAKWTKIDMDCMIYPNHEYCVIYSLEKTENTLQIKSQSISQSVPANNELFINEDLSDNYILNIYGYNIPITVQARVYIVLFALILIQTIVEKLSKKYRVY